MQALRTQFAELVTHMNHNGYLDDDLGSSCPNDRSDRVAEGQRRLPQMLDTQEQLWPLSAPGQDPWSETRGKFEGHEPLWWSDDDRFFDIIEAVHDLTARPRLRWMHRFHEDWDYSDFSRPIGQAIYRWKVNVLLARTGLDLQLAHDGDDIGFLVRTTRDDRDQLIARTLTTPDHADSSAVAHAVQLVRARGANRDAKRGAILALSRLLEGRRDLIKTSLPHAEGELFQIANKFDLRHRDSRQLMNYDDAFLDWIFWWYLATIELTDRLIAR